VGRFELETIMELVNGVKDQKTQLEVVMGALENLNMGNNKNLSFVAARIAHNNTTVVQTNNTLFLYNFKEKDGENEAVCYPFNIDLRPQFAANIYNFIARMQKRGFTGLTFVTKDPEFLRAIIKITPTLNKYGTKTSVVERKDKHILLGRVKLGKKRIDAGAFK
jgi:hypothetical protein